MEKRTPTRDELLAAAGRTVTDVIGPELQVLFCGINPGLYTAVVGHHFARPGNRFWKALHTAGFTDRLLHPFEERQLLAYGYGITNLVDRATATAAELSDAELATGRWRLEKKILHYAPRWLAVLGLGAYRTAFGRPRAGLGRQEEPVAGARVWVLPNPSGLNASYRPDDFTRLFRELRSATEAERPRV